MRTYSEHVRASPHGYDVAATASCFSRLASMRTLKRIVRVPSMLAGKALNQLLETSAQLADRCLYKPHVVWWNDRAWLEPYQEYLDGERILDRRFTLVQWAGAARGLSGSTAECGVYQGVGSASICKALEGTYAEGERHFGFDSFEGLSDPCEADRRPREAKRSWALWYAMRKDWRRGDLRCPQEVAQGRVRNFPFCELIQGWIPTSFAQVPPRPTLSIPIPNCISSPGPRNCYREWGR